VALGGDRDRLRAGPDDTQMSAARLVQGRGSARDGGEAAPSVISII
jgi:hypothetical protein